MPTPPVDHEFELLKVVQIRAQQRKLSVLTRLARSLDLPLDEHLADIAGSIARKRENT
jgi:predicted nucleic acid-binding protein